MPWVFTIKYLNKVITHNFIDGVVKNPRYFFFFKRKLDSEHLRNYNIFSAFKWGMKYNLVVIGLDNLHTVVGSIPLPYHNVLLNR